MAERVVAVIEARMGSTRLPGKSMMPLGGAPLVQHVVERVGRAKRVDSVVLATSVAPADDVLAALGANLGISVHRGSEHDVLSRILGAVRAARGDIHVQCWGDCPFVDPDQIDSVVDHLRTFGGDLVSNCVGSDRKAPYGLDVIALRVDALERAERETRNSPYHREHGTTYIYETPGAFTVARIEIEPDIAFPKLDLTVNTEEDYRFVEAVYAGLLPQRRDFRIRDVLRFLDDHPDVINAKNVGFRERA